MRVNSSRCFVCAPYLANGHALKENRLELNVSMLGVLFSIGIGCIYVWPSRASIVGSPTMCIERNCHWNNLDTTRFNHYPPPPECGSKLWSPCMFLLKEIRWHTHVCRILLLCLLLNNGAIVDEFTSVACIHVANLYRLHHMLWKYPIGTWSLQE